MTSTRFVAKIEQQQDDKGMIQILKEDLYIESEGDEYEYEESNEYEYEESNVDESSSQESEEEEEQAMQVNYKQSTIKQEKKEDKDAINENIEVGLESDYSESDEETEQETTSKHFNNKQEVIEIGTPSENEEEAPPGTNETIKIGDVVLSEEGMSRLDAPHWYNDNIIDAFVNKMNQINDDKRGKANEYAILPTGFWEKSQQKRIL